MINLTKKQEDLLFTQCRSSKSYCELQIEDDQQRYQDSWLYFRKLRPSNIEKDKKVLDFVAPVLQDCVTILTPQILDIFTENDNQAVVFRNLGFKPNPVMDMLINSMINRTILRENDGYKIIENSIKDCLISGNSFIKFYIEEKLSKDKLKLQAYVSIDDVASELKEDKWSIDLPEDFTEGKKKGKYKGVQWQTRMSQASFNPDGTPLPPQPVLEIMGTIPIIKLEKFPRIRNVGMQDLIFDITCGEEFDRCRYICHKNTVTVGEGMAMGYPKELLERSSTINRLGEASYSKVNLVTGNQINAEDYTQLDLIDPLERCITLDEHYIYSSIPSDGKETKMYQVVMTDDAILDVNEIEGHPFVNMQMEVIPDSFFGASLYDRCKMYQDVLSTMVRIGVKQNIKAVYNKHLAAKGKYDRDALLSDEPNVIIEVDVAGAVEPYVPPQLDQSFNTILEYVNSSAQTTINTTVGNLSTEDGVPKNTAAATVAMILANEGLKSKVVAKTIARTGLVPLQKIIYNTMKQEGYTVELPTGEVVSASDWPDIYDFVVDINTQRDEVAQNEQIIATLQTVAQLAAATEQSNIAGSLITPVNLFNVANKLCAQVSIEDMTPYITDPSQQQPDPEQVRKQQIQSAMTEEMAKLQIDEQRGKNAKLAAEVNEIEAKTDELVQNGVTDREVKFDTSLATIQKHRNDAADKAQKNAINDKAVNAEITMNTAKHNNDTLLQEQEMVHKERNHLIDITIPQLRTRSGGVPNGVRQ